MKILQIIPETSSLTKVGLCSSRKPLIRSTQGRPSHGYHSQRPVFLPDGMSYGRAHPDLSGRVERFCRGILPLFHLREEGGFLYLSKRIGVEIGARLAQGDIVWLRNKQYSTSLAFLDRVEAPWRKRASSMALPDGDEVAGACWVYLPEGGLT